jgi:hypothetical protein
MAAILETPGGDAALGVASGAALAALSAVMGPPQGFGMTASAYPGAPTHR